MLAVVGASMDAATSAAPRQAGADDGVDIEFEQFADGLIWPVDIQNTGGDELYVAERRGMIRVLDAEGTIRSEPFLDIRGSVDATGTEMGLLGLAFHPDYADNGELYVNYTAGGPRRTIVSRFTVASPGASAPVVDPDTEEVIVEFRQPAQNHNGGQLLFGPDGYLYIASGDGGSVPAEAQSDESLLGGVLRIDVDSASAGRPPDCSLGPDGAYRIPADNPPAERPDGCGELWLTGLRNPWRMSFDPQTLDLWIGDVGEDQREEINVHLFDPGGGTNFGWPCKEGTLDFDPAQCGPRVEITPPVFEYAHESGRCSVTGGHVYRGDRYPDLVGRYVFGEFCSNEYFTLAFPDGAAPTAANVSVQRVDPIGEFPVEPATFGLGADGQLYVASLQGDLWAITTEQAAPTPTPTPRPTAVPTPTPTPTPIPGLPEVDMASSCLGENGRIDVIVRNQGSDLATYSVEIETLTERRRSVAAGAQERITATGRPDGTLRVVVRRDGTLVGLKFLPVACDPPVSEEVTVTGSCLWGRGRVVVQVRNTTLGPLTYEIDVGSFTRTRTVDADDTTRVAITGLADGPADVAVVRNGVLVHEDEIAIACR